MCCYTFWEDFSIIKETGIVNKKSHFVKGEQNGFMAI